MDNVFTERLWRSVKYEEVYLNDYAAVSEAKEGIGNYIDLPPKNWSSLYVRIGIKKKGDMNGEKKL